MSVTQGKPKPTVSWLKNGQALDTKRVNIRSTDRDSILFIRSAEREDSGEYEMCVKVDDFEDKAIVTLQIVGEHLSLLKSIYVFLGGGKRRLKVLIPWCFCRAARSSRQREDRGHLGLQCGPGVDRSLRQRKHRHHRLHGAEGRQKDRSKFVE